MTDTQIHRRLTDLSHRLKNLRSELAVTSEQAQFLDDEAEDARLRALVAETPIVEIEARDTRKVADAMGKAREALIGEIKNLEREQDELLDRLAQSQASSNSE